jgi:tetratricopeptide (TPR) repeat protein
LDEAIAQYEEALRLKPGLAEAHFALAVALLNKPGRTGDAVAHLEAGLLIRPGDTLARKVLADIRASAK